MDNTSINDIARRYTLRTFWSDEDEAYITICPPFPGHSAFGDTPEESAAEGLVALELLIESHIEAGDPLPEAPRKATDYSGKFALRLPKTLHAHLAEEASEEGVSLNTYIVTKLARGV